MISNHKIWPPLIQEKIAIKHFPFQQFFTELSAKSSNLTVLDTGLSGPFVLKRVIPFIQTDFRWEFIHVDSETRIYNLEAIKKFASEQGFDYYTDRSKSTLKIYNDNLSGDILIGNDFDLRDPLKWDLSSFQLLISSFETGDLNRDNVLSILTACCNYELDLFLGPLYEGSISWKPQAANDSKLLSDFNRSLMSQNNTVLGYQVAQYIINYLSQSGYTLEEKDINIYFSKDEKELLKKLVQLLNNTLENINTSNEESLWASQKLYQIEAGKQAAEAGFKFIVAKLI